MNTFNNAFKEEVFRLARKEVKKQLDPLKKANSGLRTEIVQLKKQIRNLERKLSQGSRGVKPRIKASADTNSRLRYSTKGLISLRNRLGLSQTEFGKLIGVTQNTVHNWEAKKSTPRRTQLLRIAALRGKGKKEVRKLLSSEK